METSGAVTSAWLRVTHDGGSAVTSARPLATSIERDPPVSEGEAAWIERAARAAADVRDRG